MLAGQSSARAIIVSDDALPVITVKAVTATISESDGQAEFSAEITRNPWREVKLAFRTIPTTATVGKRNCDSYGGDSVENHYLIPDYKETRGTIEFQPNPNSQWPTATITYTHPTSRTETFTPTISQSFPTITVPVCDDSDAGETIKLELDVIRYFDDLDDPAKNFPLTDLAVLMRAPAEVTIEDGGGGGTVPPIDELEECLEDPMTDCPELQQDAGDPDPDPPIEVPVQNNQGAGDPDPPIEVPVQDNRGAGDPSQRTPAGGQPPAGGAGSQSAGSLPAAQQAGRAAADLDLTEAGAHADAIKELHDLGVLDDTECDAGGFCWNQPISRETAAVWIVRVLDGGDDEVTAGSTRFTDVDAASPWAGHIERLADLEVTIGCSTDPLRFCPNDPVTRAQMAAFLVRAFDLAAADSAGFEDTVGSIFEADIDALYAAGVTLGCSIRSPAVLPAHLNHPGRDGQLPQPGPQPQLAPHQPWPSAMPGWRT